MGTPASELRPAQGWPSQRRWVLTAAGFGLVLGVLGSVGWHAEPTSGAVGFMFTDSSSPPSREQLENWTDMWRPVWWPILLGFPITALVAATTVGRLTVPLVNRPQPHASGVGRVARPAVTLGMLGLMLGGLSAVAWHYHPFIRREPPPLVFSGMSEAQRERIVDRIQAGPAGGRVDDWADLLWLALVAHPLVGALLGFAAGLTVLGGREPSRRARVQC